MKVVGGVAGYGDGAGMGTVTGVGIVGNMLGVGGCLAGAWAGIGVAGVAARGGVDVRVVGETAVVVGVDMAAVGMFVIVNLSGEMVVMLPDECHKIFNLPGSPVSAGPRTTPSWPDSGSPAICEYVTKVPGLVVRFAWAKAGLAKVIAAAGVAG